MLWAAEAEVAAERQAAAVRARQDAAVRAAGKEPVPVAEGAEADALAAAVRIDWARVRTVPDGTSWG